MGQPSAAAARRAVAPLSTGGLITGILQRPQLAFNQPPAWIAGSGSVAVLMKLHSGAFVGMHNESLFRKHLNK
jgi:hypothetical protein